MRRLIWWTVLCFEIACIFAGCQPPPAARSTPTPPPAVPTERPSGPPAPAVRLTHSWPSCTQLRIEVGHPSYGAWQKPPNVLLRYSRDQVRRHPTSFLFATAQAAPTEPWRVIDILCSPLDSIQNVTFISH